MRVTMKKSSLGFGKIFNVLQSLNGRIASRPMRNIETFPSNQMYLCLSLVERKVESSIFMTYFHCFFRTIDGDLVRSSFNTSFRSTHFAGWHLVWRISLNATIAGLYSTKNIAGFHKSTKSRVQLHVCSSNPFIMASLKTKKLFQFVRL